jgi:hypothetical protein
MLPTEATTYSFLQAPLLRAATIAVRFALVLHRWHCLNPETRNWLSQRTLKEDLKKKNEKHTHTPRLV